MNYLAEEKIRFERIENRVQHARLTAILINQAKPVRLSKAIKDLKFFLS